MNEGRVVTTSGLNVPVEEYEQHFQERHMRQSTALHSVQIPERRSYLVGPLARINLCFDQLSPTAKREAENCGIAWPSRNNFQSIVARAVEMIDAYEEAIAIIQDYNAEPAPEPRALRTQAGHGLPRHRSPSRPAVPPLPHRRRRPDRRSQDRPAHVAEPGPDRRRLAGLRPPGRSAWTTPRPRCAANT